MSGWEYYLQQRLPEPRPNTSIMQKVITPVLCTGFNTSDLTFFGVGTQRNARSSAVLNANRADAVMLRNRRTSGRCPSWWESALCTWGSPTGVAFFGVWGNYIIMSNESFTEGRSGAFDCGCLQCWRRSPVHLGGTLFPVTDSSCAQTRTHAHTYTRSRYVWSGASDSKDPLVTHRPACWGRCRIHVIWKSL